MRRTQLDHVQALLNRDYALPAGTTANLVDAARAGVDFALLVPDGIGRIRFACSCMGVAYTHTSNAVGDIGLRCAWLRYSA